jgi:hypothetical protein
MAMSARVACAVVFVHAIGVACSFRDTGTGGDASVLGDAVVVGAFPFLSITSAPSGTLSGLVEVEYLVFDEAGVAVDVTATWTSPTTPVEPATPGMGTNLMVGIDTTPDGVALTFVWDSSADYPGDVDGAEICLQATSASGVGEVVCTAPFDLRNAVAGADQVRISEVITGSEDRLELVNLGTVAVDLDGFSVGWTDTSGLADVILVADTYLLDPGARVILRENTGAATAGALDLGVNISWSNATGGSAELLDLFGASVDFVRWGGSDALPSGGVGWTQTIGLPTPPDEGASLSRVAATDTDTAADFCATGATPGAANGPCLTITAYDPGELLISEVALVFPGTVEVINVSGTTANLRGLRLEWSSIFGGGAVLLPDVDIPAGARFVVTGQGGTPGPTAFVGPETIAWSRASGAALGGGTAAILDAFGSGIDFVRWGETDATDPPPGVGWDESGGVAPSPADTVTLTRSPELVDTDTPVDFCVAAPTFGAPNASCLADGTTVDLLITEISCGSPDWVEVTNAGTTDTDLLGWWVDWSRPGGSGGASEPLTGGLPLPSYSLAAGARVVLADGDAVVPNQLVFGVDKNITWGSASGWSGAAVLLDPYGAPEDFVRWGTSSAPVPIGTSWSEPGGGLPAPVSDDEHVSRDEGLGDNDVDTDWCVVAAPGTTGAPNDSCP